jgi:diacylglycerol kinase family enzyme
MPPDERLIEQLHADVGWRSAPPAQRPVLFINPRSGDGKAARAALAEHARALGIEATVLAPEHDLTELAAEAVAHGADLLGMAGGDGSLAIVAAAALSRDLPFVCIPAGTRNHFALDVGVVRHDLLGALAAFTDGVERRVDVAEVNGRVFVNNVSLGIYGDAVQAPAYRGEKARVLLDSARAVLGADAPARGIVVTDDQGREHRDPAVVLVSNNPYALAGAAPGTRPRLDTGRLGVIVLERPGGSTRPDHAWTTPALTIEAPGTVDAARDGEAVRLDPPVRFAIRPLGLRVRISARHPGTSPSGLLGRRRS